MHDARRLPRGKSAATIVFSRRAVSAGCHSRTSVSRSRPGGLLRRRRRSQRRSIWSTMQHPPLDVLRDQPLPDVAAALRAASERILKLWREVVIQTLPHAEELTRKQFEDSVPALLRGLADALAASKSGPTDKFIADGPEHGTVRFHQQFNLNELL